MDDFNAVRDSYACKAFAAAKCIAADRCNAVGDSDACFPCGAAEQFCTVLVIQNTFCGCEFSTVMLLRPVQYLNALKLMLVTFSGIVMLVRLVHFSNA